MLECPTCNGRFAEGRYCPKDGTLLLPEPHGAGPMPEQQLPETGLKEDSAQSVSSTCRFLLPHPLASLYRLYRASPTLPQQHGDAILLAQGIFRYLSLVCLADAIAFGASDKQVRKWRQGLINPGPGKYLWVLEKTEAFLSAQGGAFLSEIHDLVQNDWNPLVGEIVGDRNELAHDRIALSREQARESLENLRPYLDTLLSRVQFLGRYLLGSCFESEEVKPGCWRSTWSGCRGGEEVCEALPLYTPFQLKPEAVMLLDPRRGRSLVVSPFLWRTDRHKRLSMYWLTNLDTARKGQTRGVYRHPVMEQEMTSLLPRVYGRDEEGVTVEAFLEHRNRWCRRLDLRLDEASLKLLCDVELPSGFEELEFKGLIGSGSMGTVWEVRHRGLNRKEALKLLKKELLWHGSHAKRFRREGKTIQMLQHPRVVAVYDMNQTRGGQPYIRMELINGLSLGQRVARTGGLPLDEALTYTNQLLDALEHVHARGVVHRDVKPSNVMLCEDGVRLIDFGIARLDQGTRYTRVHGGTVLGTDAYMAPEQRDGEASTRSDLYAVASTLFTMLASRAPKCAVEEELGGVVAGIPPALDAFYRKATRPRAEERFQSAAEMRAALRTEEIRQAPQTEDRSRQWIVIARGPHIPGAGKWPVERDAVQPVRGGGGAAPGRHPDLNAAPCRAQILLRSMLCLGGPWPEGEHELIAEAYSGEESGVRFDDGSPRPARRTIFTAGDWICHGDAQAVPIWTGLVSPGEGPVLPTFPGCPLVLVDLLLRPVVSEHRGTSPRPRLLGRFSVALAQREQSLRATLAIVKHANLAGWTRRQKWYQALSDTKKTVRMVLDGAGLLGLEVQVRDLDLIGEGRPRGECVEWSLHEADGGES